MSTVKQAHLAWVASTKAIENKVEQMDMAGLLDLAMALKVPVPAVAKAIRGHERKLVTRPSARASKVLRGYALVQLSQQRKETSSST
jgi:hypothetical protein